MAQLLCFLIFIIFFFLSHELSVGLMNVIIFIFETNCFI